MNCEPCQQAASGGRARFRGASRCQPVDRPPVWLMRQAGRCLPEYRDLRHKYSFLELVQTPDLAVEVTLQPIRRFGFDAAILFSDILVIPEAMGQPYRFRDSGGIQMEYAIRSMDDISRLRTEDVVERLAYVDTALRILRSELGADTALLGFAGSPWTLANFMIEGGSAEVFQQARGLHENNPRMFEMLMSRLTAAVTAYLRMQIETGVDAVQIFDTLGGLLGPAEYEAASGRWIREIIAGLQTQVPVIVFAKDVRQSWDVLVGTGARVLGVDARMSLTGVRQLLPPSVAIQGNLDPALLVEGTPESVAAATRRMMDEMRGRPGHIVNLGHGVPPQAKLENIGALVHTVAAL